MAQSCVQPFDCGSQFKCVNGVCIPLPDCSDGGADCGPGEENPDICTAPQGTIQPDADTPNCGLGDASTDYTAVRDCVEFNEFESLLDCSTFCDEWSKVTGNLTPDTELKDCKTDDACSACRTCQNSGDVDEGLKDAVIKQYNDEIERIRGAKAAVEIAQQAEQAALLQAKDDAVAAIDDQIAVLDAELAGLDLSTSEGIARRNEIVLEKGALSLERNEVINQYTQDRLDMEQAHAEELRVYDDQIRFLEDERDKRVDQIEGGRGICVNIEIPNRPCFCPPYVNQEGKFIDDSSGKECYLCNTETGGWEYRADLCTISCTRCVVCDDGQESCATVTSPIDQANDLCVKAQDKCKLSCAEVKQDSGSICPYPQQSCEVTGPFAAQGFSYAVSAIDGSITIMQGGTTPLPSSSGVPATIKLVATNNAAVGTYYIRVSPESEINGQAEIFERDFGRISFSGTEACPEAEGKPRIVGPSPYVGSELSVDMNSVLPGYTDPVYSYRWLADGKPITVPDGDGNPQEWEGETYFMQPSDVGKLIQVVVSLEANLRRCPLGTSAPYGPVLSSAQDYTGEILVSADTEYKLYNTVIVDYSSLFVYRPEIDPIGINWIDVLTGTSVGAEKFLFLSPGMEGRQYFPRINFVGTDGNPSTLIGPTTPEIEFANPPADPPSPDPVSFEFEFSTDEPKEGDTISVGVSITSPNGIKSGPFFQWYRNDGLLFGYREPEITVTQKSVGGFLSVEATFFDNYGNRIFATSDPIGPVANEPDTPTGILYLNGEPKIGNTLTTTNNIQDLDGFGKEGLQYSWTADDVGIAGADKPFLKLTESLEVIDKFIRCIVYYTDDYGVDKEISSTSVGPVVRDSREYRVSISNATGVTYDQPFDLDIILNGPPGAVTNLKWVIQPPPGFAFVPAPDNAASEGPLVNGLWGGNDEIDCPEGWDCYAQPYKDDEVAPLGSAYHYKCPYPGYPELTFEESQDENCKLLCEDYCYSWSWTGYQPPLLDQNTILTSQWSIGGATTYNLRTCVPNDDCPPGFEKNYVAVFRVETPSWDYYQCSCELPFGPKKTVDGGVEWSTSIPGIGPWTINPREREFIEGSEVIADLGCQGTSTFGRFERCAGNIFTDILYKEELCGDKGNNGGFFGGKANGQRGFVLRDANDNTTILYHGYTMWPYWYREEWINQNTAGTVFGSAPRYNVPPLPVEQLPPRCVDAPTQVGYYDIASDIFTCTLSAYEEILEQDPLGLGFLKGATFRELRPGELLYPDNLRALRPPPMPEREAVKKEKPPVVLGPQNAVYRIDSPNRSVVGMSANVPGVDSRPTAWRFSDNKSVNDPSGYFAIDAAGGIIVRQQGITPRTYRLTVQAFYQGLWSKNFVVVISVV